MKNIAKIVFFKIKSISYGFMILISLCLFSSCDKDVTPIKGNEIYFKLDSASFTYEDKFYYDNTLTNRTNWDNYQTLTSETIIFRIMDTVNLKIIDEYRLFSTRAKSLHYTDTVLGYNEAAQFALDAAVESFLAPLGIGDTAALSPSQQASIDSIHSMSAILAGPLRSFHRGQFNHPVLIGNNSFGIFPLGWGREISSYTTHSDPFLTYFDDFYPKTGWRGRKVRYVIPAAIEGWQWRFSFAGTWWDNWARSWKKRL